MPNGGTHTLYHSYLQESGFVHSAFSFANESMIAKTGMRSIDKSLPPGALVTFLQKGLQYVGIEENLRQPDDAPVDFTLLSPATIASIARKNPPIKLNVPPATAAAAVKARLEAEARLQQQQVVRNPPMVDPFPRQALTAQAAAAALLQHQIGQPMLMDGLAAQQRAAADMLMQQHRGSASALQPDLAYAEPVPAPSQQKRPAPSGNSGKKSSKKKKVAPAPTEAPPQAPPQEHAEVDPPAKVPAHVEAINGEQNGEKVNGSTKVPVETPSPRGEVHPEDKPFNAPDDEVLKLEKHQSEVFMCAWNPIFTELIATGSGDASARIWQMGGLHAKDGLAEEILLPHGADPRDRKNKDVTTLEWSSDGTLLATGSYDGVARVWARTGALIHTLRGHSGPIFSLKWNKKGNFLLSGSYDKTTIVWDVSGSTGFVEQQFTHHTAPALDVDWKDNETFASCSTDQTVQVCRVGMDKPLQVFSGHDDEVNAVKWDPSGSYLASCSDDSTAKIWEFGTGRSEPLHKLTAHQAEIYTVKWSPTGPGSKNPSKKPLLATASFDGTVRLWNIKDGSCFRIFNRHRLSVYSVSFSPSGDFLASGSLAGQMYIWNIKEDKLVKSYLGKGDIFEVSWNNEETRVAACFSANAVAVVDFDSNAAR